MSGTSAASPALDTTLSSASPSDARHSDSAAQLLPGTSVPESSPLKQPPVDIPARSTSNQKAMANSPSTDPNVTNAAVAESSSPRRGSKRSLLNRSRNNSTSSKRSLRGGRTADTIKASAPPMPSSETNRTDKKTRSGFLAFLNCCSSDSHDGANPEDAIPAKKTKLQPVQQPQKSVNSTERTGNSESDKEKDARIGQEDKVSQAPRNNEETEEMSEKRPVEDPRPRMVREENSHDKTTPLPTTVAAASSIAVSGATSENTKDLPQVPQTYSSNRAPTTETPAEQSTQTQANGITPIIVEPSSSVDHSSSSPETNQDKDVEMADAPPAARESVSVHEITEEEVDEDDIQVEEHSAQRSPRQQTQIPAALPPPPPLPAPPSHVHVTVEEDSAISGGEQQHWLLPPIAPNLKGRKCLVLDLDETLVHSSFKILNQADFTIPVEIEGQNHDVYVIKRPGVDAFMKRVGELYEVVIFTASVSKYGDPLLDQLDIHHVVHHRLFRESCYVYQGSYVKDLSQVGRELKDTIIIDNSPTSYIFHPQHALPISSWFSDAHDNELLDLIPVLEDLAGPQVSDVSLVLDVAL